ncbi:MAG: 1-deoxy-D-xylulose-5-phosphate synthase N-terminal domain-containing protein [Pseudomonadota bacterium]|nr:1-deoxy-D-xylulose-5-phosphate synthase N-terminal domain-containing protein [Pseudomonadota bacterium]
MLAERAQQADQSSSMPRSESVAILRELERKVLWLSSWMIHNANHLRERTDGLKVGGHQASSASLATIMTALYFHVLRPQDRVAVKPHASPVFHAIHYLLGRQTRDKLENFRAFGGAQSYPSRTKDTGDVDFSTGSVGLGAAAAAFGSLVQDYVRAKGWAREWPEGRMIALVGDAELDEGNIYEALLECWKHRIRNCWWVIDYNRQSLDAVISDRLFGKVAGLFETMGWHVITLKHGRKLEAAFTRPGGDALRNWIDDCPNSLYSALTFQGGAAWRRQLSADLAGNPDTLALVQEYSDDDLAALMTNLGGHDLETMLEAFENAPEGVPVCFIAYTIKGFGLPFQGHKDNHAGLMTRGQMDAFRTANGIGEGEEWDPFAGLSLPVEEIEGFLARVPYAAVEQRSLTAPAIPHDAIAIPDAMGEQSTQEGFGKILAGIAKGDGQLASRIVTTSPDVTVSTNLGPWVNRRGIFSREEQSDIFKDRGLMSPQKWEMGPSGQHIELGIAENNLFLLLAALGLSHTLFGERLIPVGTLYDPFIQRGLDALNYACYQDARFILVATPSGITLAPEGGAHQSIGTPLIGISQDGLASFEPAYVDELAVIMDWAFDYVQRDGAGALKGGSWLRDEKGGSVYLRLSTRPIDQIARTLGAELRDDIIAGGYWLRRPEPGCELIVAYSGAVAPEAIEAAGLLAEDRRGVGVLAVTSADRLSAGWHAVERAREAGEAVDASHVEQLLDAVPRDAGIIALVDGHPETLSWLGGVAGHRVRALGVEHFGQSGSVGDLYAHHGLNANAVLAAAETLRPGRPVRYRRRP